MTSFDAIKPEFIADELTEQRYYLEQLADVFVPAYGDPCVLPEHREKETTIHFPNPVVSRYEFSLPRHGKLSPITVRMQLCGISPCCDAEDAFIATYRVTVPEFE